MAEDVSQIHVAAEPAWGTPLKLAALLGFLMVMVGAMLAYVGKSEPSLVWSGSLLLVVGTIGNRISSFEATKDGLKMKMLEDMKLGWTEGGSASPTNPSQPASRYSPPVGNGRMQGSAVEDEEGADGEWAEPDKEASQRAFADLTLAASTTRDPRELGRILRQIAELR